jgi:hypothetical protein
VFSHCWVMCILNKFHTKKFWVQYSVSFLKEQLFFTAQRAFCYEHSHSQYSENDLHFLQIVWQNSLYDSSSASAFTYICLRSVISSNKFWSCMSTETDMSATVIETVCIDLFIISEHIICVVQCCTLSFERFIDTFYFCLDKASALILLTQQV